MIPRIKKTKKPHSLSKQLKKKSTNNPKTIIKPRFNPKQYLEALISLQNTNCSTNRKRKNSKRDLSSALTIATPALQNTISASKIRSKSSLSQNRKKCHGNETITLNVCAMITQESNVEYTEKTTQSNLQQKYREEIKMLQSKTSQIKANRNETFCAIMIQRAWRSYQTYKMVHQRYLLEQKLRQLRKKGCQVQNPHKLHINIRKEQLQRKLQIKRRNQQLKECRKHQQLIQTKKIIQQRCKQSNYLQASKYSDASNGSNTSPIYGVLNYEASCINNRPQVYSAQLVRLSKQIKSKQAERVDEVLQLISRQRQENGSNELLLSRLMEKFESNKRAAEADARQCQVFRKSGEPELATNSGRKCLGSDQQYLGSNIKRLQHQQLGYKVPQSTGSNNLERLRQSSSSRSQASESYGFQFDDFTLSHPELKIFQIRSQNLKQQRQQAVSAVEQKFRNHQVSLSHILDTKQRIETRYQTKEKQIMKNKNSYVFCLSQLKKDALKCGIELANDTSLSLTKLKKSFSVGSTVLKTVLDDIKVLEFNESLVQRKFIANLFNSHETASSPQRIKFDGDEFNRSLSEQLESSSEKSQSDSKGQPILEKMLNNSPISSYNEFSKQQDNQLQKQQQLHHPIHWNSLQSDDSSFEQRSGNSEHKPIPFPEKSLSTKVHKQYSQQIQQQISKYLLQQLTLELYNDERLYRYIYPYLGCNYEFTKIKDEEIICFLQQLSQFMPPTQQMLKRVNQNINPTALQILRIIRDVYFEINQYELIIPEETFKAYRAALEQQYTLHYHSCVSVQQLTDRISKIINSSYYKQSTINFLCNQRTAINNTIKIAYQREQQKHTKHQKYVNFERDLRIMYMKSVFNCLNEFLIQTKSMNCYMNGRSSIGPGELTFAIKQYNEQYGVDKYQLLMRQVQEKLIATLNQKSLIPSFRSYSELNRYQEQIMKQIEIEHRENEYKWVNYMDEVLEIWQDVCIEVLEEIIGESVRDILFLS